MIKILVLAIFICIILGKNDAAKTLTKILIGIIAFVLFIIFLYIGGVAIIFSCIVAAMR